MNALVRYGPKTDKSVERNISDLQLNAKSIVNILIITMRGSDTYILNRDLPNLFIRRILGLQGVIVINKIDFKILIIKSKDKYDIYCIDRHKLNLDLKNKRLINLILDFIIF